MIFFNSSSFKSRRFFYHRIHCLQNDRNKIYLYHIKLQKIKYFKISCFFVANNNENILGRGTSVIYHKHISLPTPAPNFGYRINIYKGVTVSRNPSSEKMTSQAVTLSKCPLGNFFKIPYLGNRLSDCNK